MDVEEFWAVVESTRAAAANRPGSVVANHVATLTTALAAMPDARVVGFERRLRLLVQEANRWDLWAAGYLALGGMSDDGFTDFRTWLVSQGRANYTRTLADPDALVDLSWDEDEEDFGYAEEWGYAAGQVLESRGLDVDDAEGASVTDPDGTPFPEDDDAWFARHLPRLWSRYGDQDN